MEKNKHKPPSRKRYEKNYPVWSVRMPKEWINEVKVILESTEQSRRDFLGVALKKQKFNHEKAKEKWDTEGYDKGYKEGHENGYNEGHNKGMNDWAIWVYCCNCWKPFFVKPNSDDHKEIIDQMKGYLKHPQCPQE